MNPIKFCGCFFNCQYIIENYIGPVKMKPHHWAGECFVGFSTRVRTVANNHSVLMPQQLLITVSSFQKMIDNGFIIEQQ